MSILCLQRSHRSISIVWTSMPGFWKSNKDWLQETVEMERLIECATDWLSSPLRPGRMFFVVVMVTQMASQDMQKIKWTNRPVISWQTNKHPHYTATQQTNVSLFHRGRQRTHPSLPLHNKKCSWNVCDHFVHVFQHFMHKEHAFQQCVYHSYRPWIDGLGLSSIEAIERLSRALCTV